MFIKIGNNQVMVFGENTEAAIESWIFQEWCRSLNPAFMVHSIEIQSVDFVERANQRQVLFIKLKVDIRDRENRKLPGIIFLRGHSVGLLVVLECDGQEYVVLVNQARPAIGVDHYPELPAGMVDGQGDVRSVALRELEEEIGLQVETENITSLSQMFFGDKWGKIYPSPGACDEGVELFLVRQVVSREMLESFIGKMTGAKNEGEYIRLAVYPIEEVCRQAPCALLHSAYIMYMSSKQKGK